MYDRLYSASRMPVEHHIRVANRRASLLLCHYVGEMAVASLDRERRFFFCLPERGGDADVRYLGNAVPACRIHNGTSDLHRQS